MTLDVVKKSSKGGRVVMHVEKGRKMSPCQGANCFSSLSTTPWSMMHEYQKKFSHCMVKATVIVLIGPCKTVVNLSPSGGAESIT